MSRSTKLPWVSDPSKSWMKSVHARRMRRCIKQKLQMYITTTLPEDLDMGLILPVDDEVTNPYDICDYKFYYTACPKSFRK